VKKIRIVPILSILIGIYWLFFAVTEYGLWTGTSPGAGFMPAIVGIMLILFSLMILKTPAVYKPGALQKKTFYPVIAAVLALASVYLVGLIIAMGLFVLLWLLILEKFTLIKSAVFGVSATVFVYLVFKVWLMVPFPKGLLGIL